jgi:hypothetical protein
MKSCWAVAGLLFWSGCHSASNTKPTPKHQLKSIDVLIKEERASQHTALPSLTALSGPLGAWYTTGMPALDKSQFMPLFDGGGNYHAVLQHTPDEGLATGDPRLTLLGESLVMQRDLKQGSIPAEYSAWVGQSLRLFSAEQPLCEVKVESLALVGLVSNELFAEEVSQLKDHPETFSTLAKSAWKATEEGQGPQYLTAVLSFAPGCGGARFARLASLPNPTQIRATPTTGTLSKEAIHRFRELSEYKAVQRSYRAQSKLFSNDSPTKPWDSLDDTLPKVSVFQLEGSAPMVWVSAATAYYGCDGALFSLDAAFSLQNTSENLLAPFSAGIPSGELISPLAALDVDLDGSQELLTGEGLWRLQGGKFQEWVSLGTPNFSEAYCGE